MSQSQEFAENKEDRCPVVLVLDRSYSMLDGKKIDALNDGVQQFRDEVLKDSISALRIEVAVVSFGGTVQVENDFTTALDFQPSRLDADGQTPMGAAVRKALELIEDRKAIYRSQGVQYFRPWVWLMTDGQPTEDDWRDAAQQARKAQQDRKVTVYAVGIGDDADMSVLEQFSERKPLKLKGLQFREMFKWLSASLTRVSQQKAGAGQQVELPPVDGWGTAVT